MRISRWLLVTAMALAIASIMGLMVAPQALERKRSTY